MQKCPEQAFICKIIRNIHAFVNCKMHITVQTEEKIHYIHLYAKIVHGLCIGWAGCVTNRSV